MKWLLIPLYDAYRKHFGAYAVRDPRPNAQEAPYTFYLPPQDHLDAIVAGDIVKLVIESQPASREFDAERMWVQVTDREGSQITGALDNIPLDIPQLTAGTALNFEDYKIIDIDFQDKENRPALKALSKPKQKQYWDRCMVDDCVLDGYVRVGYIYREVPDLTQKGDENPDSGWRIRGDVQQMTDDQYENGVPAYVALGAVLNQDDSWIHLIDSPERSAFLINQDTGEFEPTEFMQDQENDYD